MSTASALVAVGLAVLVDVWSIGPGRYRDRMVFLWSLAGLATLADHSGYQETMTAGVAGRFDLLDDGLVRGITTVLTTVGTIGTAFLLIFAAGAMLPRFTSRWLGRWCYAQLAGPADVTVSWKIWTLAGLIVALRPMAWGAVGVTADLVVAINAQVWGRVLGGGYDAGESQVGAWACLIIVCGVLAVFRGWRPDLALNPSPGYFRQRLAALFPQVTAAGVGGGDGDGMTVTAPGEGPITQYAEGVYVGPPDPDAYTDLKPRKVSSEYVHRPWFERQFGIAPDVHVTAHPPVPKPAEQWYPWLVESLRQDCRPKDIIAEGRRLYGGSPRTWERRIAKAREEQELAA